MASPARNNRRSKDYREMFDRLPERIQKLALAAFKTFEQNPYHPAFSLHELVDHGRGNHKHKSYSVYLTSGYRAIFCVDGDTNVWYWIGSHSDYNNFTGTR